MLVANCDAMRYCAVDIPWDWTLIQGKPPDATGKPKTEPTFKTAAEYAEDDRQRAFRDGETQQVDEFADEIDFWNDAYGT